MRFQKEFNEKDIVTLISESRKSHDGGGVSFPGAIDLNQATSLLTTALISDRFSSEAMQDRCINSALLSNDLPTDFTFEDLKRVINLKINELAGGSKKFIVVFPIVNLPAQDITRRVINGVTVNLKPSMGTKTYSRVLKERKDSWEKSPEKFRISDNVVRNADLIFCSCSATSPNEAFEKAEFSIQALLGILSLLINHNKLSRVSIGDQIPLGDMRIPPQVTVHEEDGAMAYAPFWYYELFERFQSKTYTPFVLESIDKKFGHLLDRARSSRWANNALLSCALYFDAFAKSNLTDSFLKGWKVLEIVGGFRTSPHPEIIRRAASTFEDFRGQIQIGEHLRMRRNSFTHGRQEGGKQSEAIVFQLNRFLCNLLVFYIDNPFDFKSEEELWEFLDLPNEKAERDRLRRHLDLAGQYRGH